jgi:nitroreductase
MDKAAPVDHPVHDLIRARWSPRAFASRAVDGATLASLFEAARWGASSFNEQPWRFIVATSDDAEGFRRALACLSPRNRAWAHAAPALAFSVASMTLARSGKPNRVALHDVGLAVAQLVLEATARGLVVHQMAGIDHDAIRETYRIPAGFEPVAGIALGYPGDPATLPDDFQQSEAAPRARRPLAQSVFTGSWDRSAPWAQSGDGPSRHATPG